MKNILLVLALQFLSTITLSQINKEDSSVQIISYWKTGENQVYSVKDKKVQIKGNDTTIKRDNHYTVEMTVLSMTDKSYTIQWEYKTGDSYNKSNDFDVFAGLVKAYKVIYKTNEIGEFSEIVNWKEIRDIFNSIIKTAMKEVKDNKDLANIMKQVSAMYSSKEAIEAYAIKDIQQFHSLFGVALKLNEKVETESEIVFPLNNMPIKNETEVCLTEILEDDYSVYFKQRMDPDQLKEYTFQFMEKLMKNVKNAKPVDRSIFNELKNEIHNQSKFHDSGWLISSAQTTTVTSMDFTSIESRVIELKL